MKAFVFGPTRDTAVVFFYASWNGATEVAAWQFFASQTLDGGCISIGSAVRAGFETSFMAAGVYLKGFLRAVAKDGTIHGESDVANSTLPKEWHGEADTHTNIPSLGQAFVTHKALEVQSSETAMASRILHDPTSYRNLIVVFAAFYLFPSAMFLMCRRLNRLGTRRACHGSISQFGENSRERFWIIMRATDE